MRSLNRDEKKTAVAAALTGALVVLASCSIWLLPPLGNLANPFGPFWRATSREHDYPARSVVRVPSLQGDVTVVRDQFGVPHVYASDYRDLFFAYGYLQAQDRFFEMTLLKLVGWGRLSEVLGSYAVEIDEYLRTLALWRAAEDTIAIARENAATYPHQFSQLEAFCAGVNYWVDNHRYALPLEFSLLDLPVEHWTLEDSAVMANLGGLMLSYSTRDLAMEEVRLRLVPYLEQHGEVYGSDAFNRLFPGWNASLPNEIPIVPDNHSIYAAGPAAEYAVPDFGPDVLAVTVRTVAGAFRLVSSLLFGFDPSGDAAAALGSNNWVVGGNLSTTGKPILCGDPHLMLMTPSIWYEAHLVCDQPGVEVYADPKTGESMAFSNSYDVYGVAFPGTPTILIGHNAHVAWSETNVGSDALVDYYYEVLSPDRDQYLYGGEWRDVEVVDRPIKVKWGEFYEERPFQVRFTRHGPLLTEAAAGLVGTFESAAAEFGFATGSFANVSMKWIGLNNSALYNQLVAFDLLNRADNVTAAKFALDRYPNPPQNFVLADDSGNVGMVCAGLYPVRAKGGQVDAEYTGRFVQPGDGSGEEWVGFVPPEHLPHVINPVGQDWLASSNQRTISSKIYNYSVGNDWNDNWRARSIARYLNVSDPASPFFGRKISPADLRVVQYSSYDVAAASYVPAILAAWDSLSEEQREARGLSGDADLVEAVRLLREWDAPGPYRHEMARHLVAPTIFDQWVALLDDAVWGDEWAQVGLGPGAYPAAEITEERVLFGDANDPWFDDVATAGVVEDRTDVLLGALREAVEAIRQKYGPLSQAPQDWVWGSHHRFVPLGVPLLFDVASRALGGGGVAPSASFPVHGSVRTLNLAPKVRFEFDAFGLRVDLSDYVLVGPSWRQVVDLSNPSESYGVYPGGQSEDVASPHYLDQAFLWAEGQYKQLLFYSSPSSFPAGLVGSTTTLTPGGGS
ncbi:MAG: penicillin acylase family protein [Promethearchaeota archaeon]